MALIANTLPLNLSTVKTAYGAAGNELRDYIPGGGINGHVITQSGIMGTGTINLSHFKGSTRINLGDRNGIGGEIVPNSTIYIGTSSPATSPNTSHAESALNFYSNTGVFWNTAGQLLVTAYAQSQGIDPEQQGSTSCNLTNDLVTSSGGMYVANVWLLGANGTGANSQFDPALFNGHIDVLWNQTANSGSSAPNGERGTSGVLTGNINTWVNITGTLPSAFGVFARSERETSIGASTSTYQGYLAFRMNTSPQTVLSNTFISLYSTSSKSL